MTAGPGQVADQASRPSVLWTRWLAVVEPFVAAVLYAAIVSAVTRWWQVYQFNPDEGVNLMKAALVAAGYDLYSEIWSDQPPVFTLVLVPLQWLFPANVNAARAVVLAFAALMVFSLFRIVRRADGRAAAWVAVAALAGERVFAQTSVGVLIGMPAVALALAGLDQALAGAGSNSRLRFVAAGVLIGLALQTKMFVALMLPAIALAPFVDRWSPPQSRRRAVLDLAILAAAMSAVFALVALVIGEPVFAQLLSPHSAAASSAAYEQLGGFMEVAEGLSPQTLLPVAAAGAIAFLRQRRTVQAVPIAWLLAAGIGLSFHRPFWFHHAVLILVPIAWLCGQALEAFNPFAWRPWLSAGIAGCVLWIAGTSFYEKAMSERRSGQANESPLLTKDGEAGAGTWVLSDTPIDAYRANLLVPPELAVFTEKRLMTGDLTTAEIGKFIQKYSPSEILFRRFRPTPVLIELFAHGFRPAPARKGFLHAVRRDL